MNRYSAIKENEAVTVFSVWIQTENSGGKKATLNMLVVDFHFDSSSWTMPTKTHTHSTDLTHSAFDLGNA